ncbi:MAG TPA: FUSC family protein [Solirubrobacteraceae bacterium]|nr:FUSC family protein [Solirubrobacteraceae bacterium]
MSAVAHAVRQATRFDRSAVSLRAGLIAAVPVVGVLAAGTIAGDTVAAVTMGAGAMLVGIAWRVGGGRPPVATMLIDTAVMALSTFAGAATGRLAWVHLVLLVMWAFAGGLMVAAGPRTTVVGNQAIIAFVVFGRFSQPVPAALGLAGLVLAGGLVQVLFSALFGAPPALALQRSAVAEAYRSLARIASDPGVPTGTAAASLDEAERKLASPTLLGGPGTMQLTALVEEGRRMRLEFAALALLIDQYERAQGDDGGLRRAVERLRACAAEALDGIAAVIERTAPEERAESALAKLDAATEEVASASAKSPLAEGIERHAIALAGQIRAAAGLAAGAHREGGRIVVRPSLGAATPWQQFAADLAQVRANVSLRSPAGRHAVRLAVVVPATAVLAQHLHLQRSYWVVVAAATVLRPDFAGTFTRGVERMAGTLVGVVLAGLVAVALHPSGWATVALVGVLAWAAYSVFPASFAAGIAFLTAMIVFLLEAVSPSTLGTAADRGIDTLVGGVIGLLAYVVWPTWSSTSARQALADLVTAQRDYLGALLDAVAEGRPAREEELRALARRARLAWTTAEATIERSLTEPAARRIDVEQARRVMTGLRRLVQAAHVIRLELGSGGRPPLPALRPLAEGLDRTLALIAEALATGAPPRGELPRLRALHRELVARAGLDPVLEAELDELVDAANTVAGLLGIGQGQEAGLEPRRPSRRGVARLGWRPRGSG